MRCVMLSWRYVGAALAAALAAAGWLWWAGARPGGPGREDQGPPPTAAEVAQRELERLEGEARGLDARGQQLRRERDQDREQLSRLREARAALPGPAPGAGPPDRPDL